MNRNDKASEWRAPGAVVLISCYELGHQPLAVASPLAFLREAGFRPRAMDIAVEDFSEEKIANAKFVGISVPMHTALRLGVEVAAKVRETNPSATFVFTASTACSTKTIYLKTAGIRPSAGSSSCRS